MPKAKMTQAKLDALKADYDAWNPYAADSPSADELAARHGFTKQTMYYWRRRDWKMTGRDTMIGRQKAADSSMAEVVSYLYDRVTELTIENNRLRQELGKYTGG